MIAAVLLFPKTIVVIKYSIKATKKKIPIVRGVTVDMKYRKTHYHAIKSPVILDIQAKKYHLFELGNPAKAMTL